MAQGQSRGFKKFMAMTYGLGAAIVILGALFKLMHWPGASLMLIVGLGTEAIIFFISAFEPLPADEPDWTLVYPELAGGQAKAKESKADAEGILTQKIDEMLAASNLDAQVINKLTTSVENFSNSANELSSLSGIAEKSNALNEQMESLSNNLSSLNNVYGGMLNAMGK